MASSSGSQGLGKSPLSVAAKLREQVALDLTVQSDPKFKKYAQQVEKRLAAFESMHEWPDFIAFLKQLLGTLQSYTQFKEIPRKLIVSKRLSQCLISALPSGVHQRALDVYTHILSVLGPDGLKRDLPLWSSGLFPFFEYASTSVKPTLLSLFEKYYLPLQDSLRPVMRSFILALLPGLEEETGEFFERVMALLDKLSGTVSPAFFLQNVWLIMLTTQVPRAYALNYLSRRLPRLDAGEDVTPIVGRDVGLMIRAFAAALSDENLLVQRSALDLLVSSLRLDSAAVIGATAQDRTILMRAATGVVLRRDLSLNRRLFSWLLGPEEQTEEQTGYYKTHSLTLLVKTLKDEMLNPSAEYSISRPFKIFISLLDKWEIGTPLTDMLLFDAFGALRNSVEQTAESTEDIILTANTLYDAVEPKVVWKLFYVAIKEETTVVGFKRESIDMVLFMLRTFQSEDEEVRSVHLPLVFSALVETLEFIARASPEKIKSCSFQAAMELLSEILLHVSMNSMIAPLRLPDIPFAGSYDEMASVYYAVRSPGTSPSTPLSQEFQRPESSSAVTFISSFENLAKLCSLCVAPPTTGTDKSAIAESSNVPYLATFINSISLMLSMLRAIEKLPSSMEPLKISWDPGKWLDCISSGLTLKNKSFQAVDRVVSIAIAIHGSASIQPVSHLSSRVRMYAMLKSLLEYLQPQNAPYHVRSVNLIWQLEKATKGNYLESIIAQSLSQSSSSSGYAEYESFGVLWRLTDDVLLPGSHFKVPLFIVLDTLKSTDPTLRRLGETWMRCNMRSYQRVLDPILLELLDPRIRRRSIMKSLRGREIPIQLYDKPFDQIRISYLLDILLHVINFGGQSFIRIVSSQPISRTTCSDLITRATQAGLSKEASYKNILVDVSLRFLQSEPNATLQCSMRGSNIAMQSTAIDILQAIISRGDSDLELIETTESTIIKKLFLLVHSEHLELQNKLLHLLHSVISNSAASMSRQPSRSYAGTAQIPGEGPFEKASDEGASSSAHSSPVNPLLIQCVIDGISVLSNRPIVQHWLDFVLMTIPQFPHILATAISPLNVCICRQLRLILDDAQRIFAVSKGTHTDILSTVDDANFIMLLNGLERLVLLNLNDAETSFSDTENAPNDKMQDSSGLLSMVSNVFLQEPQSQATDTYLTARSPAYRSLHEGVCLLYSVWVVVAQSVPDSHPACDTLAQVFARVFQRTQKVFERLFRAHAFEVIESVIEFWDSQQEAKARSYGLEIIDFLTSSSQNVVHMVCESIFLRINPSGERSRKQVLNPQLSEVVLLSFMEEYFEKLEGPLAVQVWPRYLSLAKDVASSAREYRLQVFPVLRCLTVLSLKVSQTTFVEDRRVRKDIQEAVGKLLDACVLISGKSMDQGIFSRRTRETLGVNGRESPIPSVPSESNLNEKYSASQIASTNVTQPTPTLDLIDRINIYLGRKILPNLRRLLMENDKMIATCGNIVYYVINPSLKARSGRLSEIDDSYITIIEEITRVPASVKTWRTCAADVFNDGKFFSVPSSTGLRWKNIVKSLFDSDKTALSELLGRIAAAPSANIFTNRDYENSVRAQNIRRLSFVLLASEKNQFLTNLPAIQEKIVDILRSNPSAVVESELYLCIRVLICRLSPHNLSSFWPVLLAEMIRIFEHVMADPPSDGSENLQPVLSACKLLDLLLVLQTVEFQIHQWIFVTDTVDAVYKPDNWFPEALMDQLADIVSDMPPVEMKRPSEFSLSEALTERGIRQPLLRSVRQIDSMRDLSPFFSHVSITSYEAMYASEGVVDWNTVEQSLIDDIFDAR